MSVSFSFPLFFLSLSSPAAPSGISVDRASLADVILLPCFPVVPHRNPRLRGPIARGCTKSLPIALTSQTCKKRKARLNFVAPRPSSLLQDKEQGRDLPARSVRHAPLSPGPPSFFGCSTQADWLEGKSLPHPLGSSEKPWPKSNVSQEAIVGGDEHVQGDKKRAWSIGQNEQGEQ